MKTPVRVLILYDSPEPSQILVRELQQGGYEPLFERVASREAMRQALSSGSWDIVLSDYRLRDFDALAALALVKESEMDIPLLVVCAGIGEETAVRLIKAGVSNCIPFDAPGRLSSAVERELREAQIRRERRLARKALRESEGRFRTLVETASDAILTVDESGRILFANRAAEKIFGYPVSSIVGEPLTMLMPDSPLEPASGSEQPP